MLGIKNNIATIQTNNRTEQIDLTKSQNFEHGYAMTTYKTQGMDTNKAFVYQDVSAKINKNSAYTATTRAKLKLKVYTTNKEAFIEKIKTEQIKSNLIDRTDMSNVPKDKDIDLSKSNIDEKAFKAASKVVEEAMILL